MKMEGHRQSSNVDDRRGRAAVVGVPIGCGTLVIALLFLMLGGDPRVLTGMLEGSPSPASAPGVAASDPLSIFVSQVLADTEDTWNPLFREQGASYSEPVLVVYDGRVESACGFQSAAVGPFYCPGDHKLYIDLNFYRVLQSRFGAAGDFAQAYVIAHEVGHHVQNLLGLESGARGLPKIEANAASVQFELQADCLAGVWAHHAHVQRKLLEEGDIEEGLRAAAALGDDNIQHMSQGYVVPEAFTHGTSEQRAGAFAAGLRAGTLQACLGG